MRRRYIPNIEPKISHGSENPVSSLTRPRTLVEKCGCVGADEWVNVRGGGMNWEGGEKIEGMSGADDKKLQAALKKLNVQPIQGIEEVNMFKEDGNVIHL
jgi:hypothetical protein